jgi:ribosome modulation factor
MSDTETMADYMDRIARQHDGDSDAAFEGVKADFLTAGPQQRAQWLEGWRSSMAEEYRATKQHAEYLTMQRELESIHTALKKAGR